MPKSETEEHLPRHHNLYSSEASYMGEGFHLQTTGGSDNPHSLPPFV